MRRKPQNHSVADCQRFIAALTLILVLSAVQITGPLAVKAMLFLGFEVALGGGGVGGALTARKRKRNTP